MRPQAEPGQGWNAKPAWYSPGICNYICKINIVCLVSGRMFTVRAGLEKTLHGDSDTVNSIVGTR